MGASNCCTSEDASTMDASEKKFSGAKGMSESVVMPVQTTAPANRHVVAAIPVLSEDRNQAVPQTRSASPDNLKPPRDQASVPSDQKIVEMVVKKTGPEDRIGMDVKHVRGRLIVNTIADGGAMHRTKLEVKRRDPDSDVIEVGDMILQVNDIKDLDTAMVAECQQKLELRITAVRVRRSC